MSADDSLVDVSDHERINGPLDRLYGEVGVARFAASHVMIVGVGGVGSWVAEALARSGIGLISLVDMDHISPSNLNRQIHALTSTIGQAKVVAMSNRIATFRSDVTVSVIDDFVTSENWLATVNRTHVRRVDVVVDACDDFRAKLVMAAWALKNSESLICVGAAGGKRLAHEVRLGDLAEVTHDPLLAKLRYGLRREHGAKRSGRIGIACISSQEPVSTPSNLVAAGSALSCSGYGSSVAVTATFGMCASSWVLNLLAGPAQKRSFATQNHSQTDGNAT